MSFGMIGDRTKTRFDPDLARRMNERADAEDRRRKLEDRLRPKAEEPVQEEKPSETMQSSISSGSLYELMDKTNTYILGVHVLREACKSDSNCVHPIFVKKDGSKIYRPLTFEENIRARLEDYNTLNNPDGSERSDEGKLRLFNTWLDGCTGIAYKKGTTLFKIITESEKLIRISEDFKDSYYPVTYSNLQGIELDSGKGKYNQLLTLDDVLKHPAWNVAVQDKSLLHNYADLFFRLRTGNNMGFFVRQNTSADELRALYVYSIYYNSGAYGDYNLYNNGRFVRVTHVAPKAP